MRKIKLTSTFALLLVTVISTAQITLVNAVVNPFNVSPNSLVQINVLNTQSNDVEVIIESRIFNSINNEVLFVKTQPTRLKPGMNSVQSNNISFSQITYSGSKQSNYIKNMGRLPSGTFNFCHQIIGVTNSEDSDQSCQEIVSDLNSFLTLVSPMDKDIIEQPNPVLHWNHSEPFDILVQGESYKMIVTEMQEDQNPESAISSNLPIYKNDILNSHQQLYPADAPGLESGKTYAWQVQQISNNRIINKTEAWQFSIPKKKELTETKYARLAKKINGGFYTVENMMLYFAFDEEYLSSNTISCKIYNKKKVVVSPNLVIDNSVDTPSQENYVLKKTGDNRYVIDLTKTDISNGFYTLEVKNEKNEKFFVKFLID